MGEGGTIWFNHTAHPELVEGLFLLFAVMKREGRPFDKLRVRGVKGEF